MSELRDNVRDEIAGIYESALRDGYVNEDDICDELGDWFDEVEGCDDATLKAAYALARSTVGENNETGVAMLTAALDMLAA